MRLHLFFYMGILLAFVDSQTQKKRRERVCLEKNEANQKKIHKAVLHLIIDFKLL